MKILLNKLNSLFYSQIQHQNPMMLDDCNNQNSQMNDNYETNTNTIQNSELEISCIDKDLLIERMFNDNLCLLNQNQNLITNSTPIINSSCNIAAADVAETNLKSILIKSSSLFNNSDLTKPFDDNNNNNSLAQLDDKKDQNRQIRKIKREGIKKQLTFEDDMTSCNSRARLSYLENSDSVSLSCKKLPLVNQLRKSPLIYSDEKFDSNNILVENNGDLFEYKKNIDDLIINECGMNDGVLLAESENSSILINDDLNRDIDNSKIYSTVLLEEEDDDDVKQDFLNSKFKNKIKKTDL
jgi:hypothetical protein